MLSFKGGAFYFAVHRLAQTTAWVTANSNNQDSPFHPESPLEETDRDFIRSQLEGIASLLDVLGARVASLTVAEALARVARPATWGDAKSKLDEVGENLRRELQLTNLFGIEAGKQSYFSPVEPLFGADFASKFPTEGLFELDEAAKCLALDRPTAAVFHLMRIMEIGIRTTARCLGIPDPVPGDRSWGTILRKIRDGINAKWPTVAARSSGDGAFFDDLYASLDAVKNPWRNATMHLEGKKTETEAEDIYVAVRGFMRKLASRMDEQGEPKA